MGHVPGYPGSHWMPPLGNYSHHIAPVAARAIANKTTTKTWTNFAGHFDPRRCAGTILHASPNGGGPGL